MAPYQLLEMLGTHSSLSLGTSLTGLRLAPWSLSVLPSFPMQPVPLLGVFLQKTSPALPWIHAVPRGRTAVVGARNMASKQTYTELAICGLLRQVACCDWHNTVQVGW
jgi:hypothetical protein